MPNKAKALHFKANNAKAVRFSHPSKQTRRKIGGKVSNGCIRMKPEDIEIFLEHVTLGMKVQIID